jgi:hypothetical protein
MVSYENICSMQDKPSPDPRDQAIRAALGDAATLSAMVADKVRATYGGSRRDVYLRTVGAYVADLGGRLEECDGRHLVAHIRGRRITLRFE